MAVTPEQKAEFIRLVSTGIYGVRAAQQVGSYKKAMQREALKDAEFAAEWDQAKKDGAEALLSLVNDDAVAMLQTPHTERTNPGVAALHTSAANSLRWAAAKMNSEFGDKHMVEHTGEVRVKRIEIIGQSGPLFPPIDVQANEVKELESQ